MDVMEKLVELIVWIENQMTRAYPYTTDQFRIETTVDQLIAHGVTVHEWKPISETPKEKGTYLVCTDNGGVLLGHWYGTAWNAGGGANKHLAYWMEKPKPPKGE